MYNCEHKCDNKKKTTFVLGDGTTITSGVLKHTIFGAIFFKQPDFLQLLLQRGPSKYAMNGGEGEEVLLPASTVILSVVKL